MKPSVFLTFLLCALPAAAQERDALPPTALQSLAVFQKMSARERVTGLVEVSGTGGQPTPLSWRIIFAEPRSATKLASVTIRGSRVEERAASRRFYPENEPPGFFNMSAVEVDCAGAFRIADREAGKAMIGFDSIDYRLRCRELSDEPVWTLTLRDKPGKMLGSIAISARNGKVLRTIWHRVTPDGRAVIDDSAMPAEFRPPPPEKLPDPFPVPPPPEPVPVEPAPPPLAPGNDPMPDLPPPPPLPPPGAPPPIPNIVPD